MKSPLFFPYRSEFLDPSVAMHSGIVKYHKGFLLMRKEKSSRKLTILSAIIRSVVVNPSHWLSRVIIQKILSLATLWEGTNTCSPFSYHPYGT